jgi:hypothetical protein
MQNQPPTSNTNIEFDYKKYNPMESWDQYLLRKMREERETRKNMGNN